MDVDHVVAVYRVDGCWGAVARSNFSGLRFREPLFRSLRDLALSYFESYFNLRREKTLRRYSVPLDLSRFDARGWLDLGRGPLVDRRASRHDPALPADQRWPGAPSRHGGSQDVGRRARRRGDGSHARAASRQVTRAQGSTTTGSTSATGVRPASLRRRAGCGASTPGRRTRRSPTRRSRRRGCRRSPGVREAPRGARRPRHRAASAPRSAAARSQGPEPRVPAPRRRAGRGTAAGRPDRRAGRGAGRRSRAPR